MLTNKLTIVPVTLDLITDESSSTIPQHNSLGPSCIIKSINVEISFFNGVDERIIQMIMKELNKQ
ncbi:hypothetical protein ACQKII_24650 [Lysinibacillus sp. NPDC048646]|uniref:hypothetical protein n=1 Tax=Lysinibacillus sp. NPDC048646 TaxID=3390574 RepID=UPI003D06E81E